MKAPINSSKTRPKHFLLDAMTLGTSGAIEMQESQGQHSFVSSETLPTRGLMKLKLELEAMGIKVGTEVDGDPLFTYVELPKGWKKEATNHAMWSDLLDNKGRKRAAIFYKAAFYDRDAHFSLNVRFHVGKDYDAKISHVSVAHVYDGETAIHSTEPLQHHIGADRETLLKNYALDDQAADAATKWLAERYPDWQNAAAYWD